jgi:hypothetical protein
MKYRGRYFDPRGWRRLNSEKLPVHNLQAYASAIIIRVTKSKR